MYIIIVSALATILIINETLNFAEKLTNNIMLILLSLIIFYFFARMLIEEKVKNVKK